MNPTRFLAGCLILCASTSLAATTGELFDAQALIAPSNDEFFTAPGGTPDWSFGGASRGNVTFFSGGEVSLKSTAEGALQFPLAEGKALMGWGIMKANRRCRRG